MTLRDMVLKDELRRILDKYAEVQPQLKMCSLHWALYSGLLTTDEVKKIKAAL